MARAYRKRSKNASPKSSGFVDKAGIATPIPHGGGVLVHRFLRWPGWRSVQVFELMQEAVSHDDATSNFFLI